MATTLRIMVISLVIISLMVTGFGLFMADSIDYYGITPDSNYADLSENFSASIADYSMVAQNVSGQVEEKKGVAAVGGDILFTASAYQIIKIPFKMLKNTLSLASDVQSDFGMPDFFFAAIIAIFIIVFAFIIISVLFRWVV